MRWCWRGWWKCDSGSWRGEAQWLSWSLESCGAVRVHEYVSVGQSRQVNLIQFLASADSAALTVSCEPAWMIRGVGSLREEAIVAELVCLGSSMDCGRGGREASVDKGGRLASVDSGGKVLSADRGAREASEDSGGSTGS